MNRRINSAYFLFIRVKYALHAVVHALHAVVHALHAVVKYFFTNPRGHAQYGILAFSETLKNW